jgi:hypothetical protein
MTVERSSLTLGCLTLSLRDGTRQSTKLLENIKKTILIFLVNMAPAVIGARRVPDKIKIGDLMSKNTHCGLIYEAEYEHRKPAVLKKMLLSTGLHFHKHTSHPHFEFQHRHVSSREAHKFFRGATKDGAMFAKPRRVLSEERFENEVKALQALNKLDLAPAVYDSWTDKTTNRHKKLHASFGFIVMAKCDSTVQDILKQRELTARENEMVKKAIQRLHEKHYLHGSLKPANTGVMLDDEQHINRVLFFDCAKTRKAHGSELHSKIHSERDRFERYRKSDVRHRKS